MSETYADYSDFFKDITSGPISGKEFREKSTKYMESKLGPITEKQKEGIFDYAGDIGHAYGITEIAYHLDNIIDVVVLFVTK